MVKKRPHEESYREAVEYARKFPSQIANMREILSELEQELDRPDFEIRSTLHSLLSGATTQAKREAVLRSYQQGLDEVDQEGRFELRRVWQVSFGDERISGVYLGGADDQVIVTTRTDKSKKTGIYALRLENGRQRWVHRIKKNYAAWQPRLGQDLLFFTADYSGDRDSFSLRRPLYAISLRAGKLAWKWLPKKEEIGDVRWIRGLFKDLLLINDEGHNLIALEAATGEERWCHPSYCRIKGELFLTLGDVLCLQYRDREIGWFLQDGTPIKKRALRFPKKNEGFIDCVYTSEDEDTVYVCLWGSWHVWDKRDPDAPPKSKSWSVVYGIGKYDAKIKWSLRPKIKGWRCQRIFPRNKVLYLCGKGVALVVERETGEVVREWPYLVNHVAGKLFFHTDKPDSWSRDPFMFYARTPSGRLRWQRKNFELLDAEGGLLFGRVGNMLVVLDEKNGKERASISLESEPREMVLVDRGSFLAVDAEWKVLSLFELSGEA